MQNTTQAAYNPQELAKNLTRIFEKSQLITQEILSQQTSERSASMPAPAEVGAAFFEVAAKLMTNPQKVWQAQMDLANEFFELWKNSLSKLGGEQVDPLVKPSEKDRRFKDVVWQENAVFDYMKQAYLLTGSWMEKLVQQADDIDPKTRQKVEFYTKQYVDALSPSNFFATNPEVLRATLESNGENLVKGMDHLLADLERSKGMLQVSMTNTKAFEVGKDLAITPGKVVYQNPMMQLIQYEPTTKDVHKTPLLIISPWINKYYILDMKPENSFVKWAVEQGFTVFIISWVNPDAKYAEKNFEDYMFEGPLAALDAIEKATGEKQITAIAYCLGGTLMSATLAYMKKKGMADRIKAVTYFTTLVDFKDAGDISVFIDENQLQHVEDRMKDTGYFDGREMAAIFNSLRANDLIWSFVVNNYLMGKEPFPFDLLYWNADSTRMPAAMHSFYLRNMYLKNKLIKNGGITLGGVPIDLKTIDTPAFMLSTREDHIAPWKSTFEAMKYFKGPKHFVLAGSGHVAGVINPPSKPKYQYWVNPSETPDADAWLKDAKEKAGSWWAHWAEWNKKYAGPLVKARKPGEGKLHVLEDAPGSYVKVRT